MEFFYETIFQNDGVIFKIAQYIIIAGSFLFLIGFGLCILLGIFSIFTDKRNKGDKSSLEDIFNVGIEWKIMGYGLVLFLIPLALFVIAGILLLIYKFFTSAKVLSWLFYPFIWLYNMLTDIPIIYYFLSAIIVLLVMIFIRLNANKKRED